MSSKATITIWLTLVYKKNFGIKIARRLEPKKNYESIMVGGLD